ncbi:MAG: Coq4 family protein [Myxococcota bacterium]
MAFRNRIRPLVARRAMRALRQNPDDTAQAIQVIGALSGGSSQRLFKRFQRSRAGQQILREKRDLYAILSDVDRLRAMPEGSLGQTIGEWFAREKIGAEGLAKASEAAAAALGARDRNEEERVFGSRLLNLHDVFHVLAGYDRDMRGEMGVLAFTLPQTHNLGIAYLVWSALRGAGWRSEMGRLIRQGFVRGLRAKWLLDQDWETLFERPIDEVREQLGVGAPPVYEQLRSAGAPPLAAA